MSDEPSLKVRLEIGHVLFLDIVGYSKPLREPSLAIVPLDRRKGPGARAIRTFGGARGRGDLLGGKTLPAMGPAPRRSAFRKNRRLPRAEIG